MSSEKRTKAKYKEKDQKKNGGYLMDKSKGVRGEREMERI